MTFPAKPNSARVQIRILDSAGAPWQSKFWLDWGPTDAVDSTTGTLSASGILDVVVDADKKEGQLYLVDEISEDYRQKAISSMRVILRQTEDQTHRLTNLGFQGTDSWDAAARFQFENHLFDPDGSVSGVLDAPTTALLIEVHDRKDSKLFR